MSKFQQFWLEIFPRFKKGVVTTGGAKCKETAANCCKLLLTAAFTNSLAQIFT